MIEIIQEAKTIPYNILTNITSSESMVDIVDDDDKKMLKPKDTKYGHYKN